MSEFPHLVFMEQNQITTAQLPAMLRKRLAGFDELYEDLPHTTAEDRPDYYNRLTELSEQLEEDLEEHFEDRLSLYEEEPESNTLSESGAELQEPEAENDADHPVELPEQDIPGQEEFIPLEPEEPPAEPPAEEPQPETPPQIEEQPQLTDEDILLQLWNQGYRSLLPSELIANGFRHSLQTKHITIGNFLLQKGKYSASYKLILNPKP